MNMGISSATKRLVKWFIHPESTVNCATAAVEQAGDRLEQQAKQLKKALKDSGRQRRDMLGLALDDLRGRAPAKKSKPKTVPTVIPPPPLYTPAAVKSKKRRG